MTAPYRLHYAPDNASLIVRLALDELGQPFETALVDRAARAQEGAAYRRLNPNGLIPVLETPEGPIFETGAILLWLCDRHPGPLMPAPDDAARGPALKWLFFVSNTLHPALRMCFYPEKYIGPDPGQQAQLRHHLHGVIQGHLDVLEAAQPAAGGAVTACDLYLACLLRWMALYPSGQTEWFDLSRWPRLRALCAGLEGRASVGRAQAAEGLGPAPFTAPVPAAPPDGSAT